MTSGQDPVAQVPLPRLSGEVRLPQDPRDHTLRSISDGDKTPGVLNLLRSLVDITRVSEVADV